MSKSQSSISESGTSFHQLRENYHAQIRRSTRKQQINQNRLILIEGIKNNIQEQLQDLYKTVKQYRRDNTQPLMTLAKFYSVYLNQHQLNTIFEIMRQGLNHKDLPLLKMLSQNLYFASVIPDKLIQMIIDLLSSISRRISSEDIQQFELLDYIYVILTKSYQPIREKLYFKLTELINHNLNLKLSKPLIHLYYILRKQYTTILKQDNLLNLIEQKLTEKEEGSIQMRVSDIVRFYIEFGTYSNPQMILIFQKLQEIIISRNYHKDVVKNAYHTLYSLLTQTMFKPKIVQIFITSHLLQHIIIHLQDSSIFIQQKQRMIVLLYQLFKQCSDSEFRQVLNRYPSQQYQNKKLIRESQNKQCVAAMIIWFLNSPNPPIVEMCLKIIEMSIQMNCSEIFSQMNIEQSLLEIIDINENQVIFKLADKLIDSFK